MDENIKTLMKGFNELDHICDLKVTPAFMMVNLLTTIPLHTCENWSEGNAMTHCCKGPIEAIKDFEHPRASTSSTELCPHEHYSTKPFPTDSSIVRLCFATCTERESNL